MNLNEEKREDFTNVQDKFMNMGLYQKISFLIGTITGIILIFLILLKKMGYNKLNDILHMLGNNSGDTFLIIVGAILILTGAINLA
jgi:hypothetical protein